MTVRHRARRRRRGLTPTVVQLVVVQGQLRDASSACHQSDTDYRAWSAELSKMKELYEEKNSTVWRSEIATSHGNTERLWQTLQSVLGEPASNDTVLTQ